MQNRSAVGRSMAAGLRPEHFSLLSDQVVFTKMIELDRELPGEQPLEPLVLSQALGAGIDEAGGDAHLTELLLLPGYASNVRHYAEAIMDDWASRRARRLAEDVLESTLPGWDKMALLERGLEGVRPAKTSGKTMRSVYEEIFLEADNPTVKRCSYPWPAVDYYTKGLRPGWLTYLAGETSHGKTAAALEIADHVLGEGKQVLYVTLEMGEFELGVRMAQRRGFKADGLYGRGMVRDEDYRALSKLIGDISGDRFIVDRAERVDEISGMVAARKPDLVILDYIQLLDIGRDSRLEGTTKNSRALKLMAGRHGVPILCLSQLSRASDQDRGKPPSLWRLRDSGSLEQDADAVVFVWRLMREDGHGLSSEGAFIVAKARMGMTGRVDFTFDGTTQTFGVPSLRHVA
jgi:replicative DNA helicase